MIDFHVHSTASDGTCAPRELAARGRAFAAMALTDHDNCDGCAEFLAAGGEGLRLAGIELSVEPGAGYAQFHLLGLGIDPAAPVLKEFLARILEGRRARNRQILANFARLGIDIPPDDIARYAHGAVLARPHFANWLVDHRYAPDKHTAFETYLKPDSPASTRCYASRFHPDQAEAIAVVHAAGGVAVMAHPRYWTQDAAALRAGLAALKEKGLDGIEAIYQANERGETIEHLRAARALDLLVTAGSDFHGANKPSIRLGMQVDGEAALLERLSSACALRAQAVKRQQGV